MAQHDYVIDNQSGLAFRQDLNNALAAVATVNSGATAPSTTYAYQLWADTTAGLLKQRNAANNAWVTIGTLGSANLGLLPSATAASTYAPLTGTGASGTWPISISGNAATATTATTAASLSGAGPLSATDYTYTADFPNVRPSLLLDFANSKALDPRISYSRASTASYVGADGLIKTAAVNEPRFDHNPATGESLGLLIEEARTNSFTYSEEFDNAAWTKTNCSITANSTIAPNGLQVADTLTSSAAGTAVVLRSLTQNPSTFSVYLKASTSTVACIRILSNVSGRNVAYNVNLSTGIISAATGNTGNLTGWTEYTGIQNVGNGWYRVFIGLSSTSNPTSDYEISPSLNRTAAASGESIFVWGAQAEGGTFPTSYIPTVASTVTRSADVAQMTGANFTSWYRQSEGTLFVQGDTQYTSGSQNYVALHGSVFASNRMALYVTSAGHRAFIDPPGIAPVINAQTSGVFRLAIAFNATNGAASFNGNAASTFTMGSISSTFTTLSLSGADSPPPVTRLRRLAYYTVRLLDAQLPNLTGV